MKIEIPLGKLCHIHNGLEILAETRILRQYSPVLQSVGRKIRGALERSGATKIQNGWKASKSKLSSHLRFEVSGEELEALIYLLATMVTYGEEEMKVMLRPVLKDLLEKRDSLEVTV